MKTYRTTVWPLALVFFISIILMLFGAYSERKDSLFLAKIMGL